MHLAIVMLDEKDLAMRESCHSKVPQLGGLKQQKFILSQLRRQKYNLKVPAGPGPSEGPGKNGPCLWWEQSSVLSL